MKNIMLDLETFGTNPFSMIISIGAVYFDPTKQGPEAIKSQFYVTIDPIASAKAGFLTDMSTICWWLDPQRNAIYKDWMGDAHFEPADALNGFSQWLAMLFDVTADFNALDDVDLTDSPATLQTAEHIAMWGNGPAFDNEILRNAYHRMSMPVPWKHFGDRCFRTMKNLPGAKLLAPPHEGPQHNALVDARQQALWLCNIHTRFGGFIPVTNG